MRKRLQLGDTCKHNHLMTEKTLRARPNGSTYCVLCQQESPSQKQAQRNYYVRHIAEYGLLDGGLAETMSKARKQANEAKCFKFVQAAKRILPRDVFLAVWEATIQPKKGGKHDRKPLKNELVQIL